MYLNFKKSTLMTGFVDQGHILKFEFCFLSFFK